LSEVVVVVWPAVVVAVIVVVVVVVTVVVFSAVVVVAVSMWLSPMLTIRTRYWYAASPDNVRGTISLQAHLGKSLDACIQLPSVSFTFKAALLLFVQRS